MTSNLKLIQPPLEHDFHTHEESRPRLNKPETIMEVLASPPPEWQVENLLIRGQTAAIVGDSQSGKTFCALELAACVATGRDFMGMRTKKGVVLYIAAEGGAGLVKRIRALISKYPELPSADFSFWRGSLELEKFKSDIEWRASEFEKEIGLVVVDTLSQTFDRTGDEQNNVDMASYVDAAAYLAKKLGGPIAIIHHCGKDASRGARGASSLRCNVDTMLMVNSKDGIRTATTDAAKNGKQRDGEPTEFSFSLRQVSVGPDGETSCVVEQAQAPTQEAKKKKPFGGDQTILFEMAKSLAKVSKDLSGPNGRPVFSRTALKQAWVNYFKPIEPSKGYESKATRPLDKLIEGGFLAWEGQGNHRPDALWLSDLP